ncbi:MAG: hypothetical protein RLZZ352_2463 [Pseudomonadota bacterium]|jgi:hypothetical protein
MPERHNARMEKFFNNAGPQQPANHYTLDPLQRVNLEELQDLIAQQRYVVLHAPRQTGKTTALYALMRYYNAGTQYRCVYVNVEPAQAFLFAQACAMVVFNVLGVVKAALRAAHKSAPKPTTKRVHNPRKPHVSLAKLLAGAP